MGPIQFPLVIISGTKPGPKLCITAGVHATEYPAIDALLRTITELDPATLAGTVIAVPVVNSMMFRTRSPFLSPIDGLNLNRTFPGSADGTISETLAHILLNEVVMQADFHIDCHGGDLPELLLPAIAGIPCKENGSVDWSTARPWPASTARGSLPYIEKGPRFRRRKVLSSMRLPVGGSLRFSQSRVVPEASIQPMWRFIGTGRAT